MQTQSIPMEQLAQIISLQLSAGGKAHLTVTGSSMLPMLHHRRDSVLLTPVTLPLHRDELILYRRESGQYVLHRIVACCEGSLICCGDNQWRRETVEPQQAMAVVSEFTRNGRTVPVTNGFYRAYVRCWVTMMPVRRPILAVRRVIGLVNNCFFRRLKRKVEV